MRELTSVRVGVNHPKNNIFIAMAKAQGVSVEEVLAEPLMRTKNQLNSEGVKDYSHVVLLFPEECSPLSKVKVYSDDLDQDKVESMLEAFKQQYGAVLIGHFEYL